MVWKRGKAPRIGCVVGAFAIGSLLAGGEASAADLPRKAAPLAIAHDWTGLYVGVNVGSVVGQADAGSIVPSNGAVAGADVTSLGAAGGVQAGFNWQFNPNWLVGLEADLGYLGVNRSNRDWFDAITIGEKATWYGTLRARTGYVTGPSLLYVTGGAAFVRIEDTFGGSTVTGLAPITSASTRSGWTVGGGIETKLSRNWSAKTEYLYISTGKHSFAANPYGVADTASFTSQFHVVKAGLNYSFSGRGDGPDPKWQRDWSGLYVGGNVGLGASSTHLTGTVGVTGNLDMNGRGFAGGLQVGYNFMLGPQWFAGIEADINYLGIDHSYQDWGDHYVFSQKTDWYGTLRGRAGYNTGAALLYLTAGGAAVKVKDGVALPTANVADSSSETAIGWAIGGGTEVALNSRWSAKVEALYIDVGTQQVQTTNGFGFIRLVDFDRRFQVVRAGLNYRFGGSD